MNRDVAKKHLDELIDEFIDKVDFENYQCSKREVEKAFARYIENGSIYINPY